MPVRRYEREWPDELVHVDIEKLGNIPDGGGWRTAGTPPGHKNRRPITTIRKNYRPVIAYNCLHTRPR